MKVFLDNVIVEGVDKGELFLCSQERHFELNIEFISKKTGKKSTKTLGYYRTPNQALRQSLDLAIHKTTAATIHELIRAITGIENKIDNQIFDVHQAAKRKEVGGNEYIEVTALPLV